MFFQHATWRSEHSDRQLMRRGTDTGPYGPAAVMPLPQRRDAYGSSRELTTRFAIALTLKEDKHDIGTKRGSRNCPNARKATRRRLAQARARHDAELHASITTLRQNIADLEQSRTLADAHLLLWRTNRTGVVADLCREYFSQFAEGYDTTAPERALTIRNFMYAVADPDFLCREYRGIEKFLEQWEIYTKFHSDMICRLREITLVDEEDNVVSIRCSAELDLGISDATLRHLYPAFHAQSQHNEKSRRIADGLIGKRYTVAFDKVLHFNRDGKMVAHESKVHLASGLMDVLKDPFAALEVLQGSVMTVDGHWNTPDVDYMRIEQEEMYEMPKSVL